MLKQSKIRILILAVVSFGLAKGSIDTCYDCPRHMTTEECYRTREKTKLCTQSMDACFVQAMDFINTTTGKPFRELYKDCTMSAAFCTKTKEELCKMWNDSIIIPAKLDKRLVGCSNYTCCKEKNCNTYLEVPPTTNTFTPWKTDMSLCSSKCCGNGETLTWQNRSCCGECKDVVLAKQVKCKETACNKLHCGAPYFASPWVTDMKLCASKCCGSTPSQIWQNRSCFGACTDIQIAKEVKCEVTHCNEKHCGASGMNMNPVITFSVVILSFIWYF